MPAWFEGSVGSLCLPRGKCPTYSGSESSGGAGVVQQPCGPVGGRCLLLPALALLPAAGICAGVVTAAPVMPERLLWLELGWS